MASAPTDDTQIKRRARRRLIGAIALVLLAVILLPMIFDAEKKPLDQDVSIQIPNQGEYVSKAPPVVSSMSPGDQKAAPTSQVSPVAEPAKESAQVEAPKEAPKAEAAPKVDAKPEAKADTKADTKADAKAETKADAKAETKADAKPSKDARDAKTEAQKARELADAKRAEALLNGAPAAPTSDKKADTTAAVGFAVQIGAFATDEKVQEARDKLAAAGLKTYIEKVSTKNGEVTRVRAGPFDSKDAAEAALGKISGLGFGNAKVVAR